MNCIENSKSTNTEKMSSGGRTKRKSRIWWRSKLRKPTKLRRSLKIWSRKIKRGFCSWMKNTRSWNNSLKGGPAEKRISRCFKDSKKCSLSGRSSSERLMKTWSFTNSSLSTEIKTIIRFSMLTLMSAFWTHWKLKQYFFFNLET